jgi:RNA polymerase sigma factor (sigma-70 family)
VDSQGDVVKALMEDFACAEASDAQLALSAKDGSTVAFETLFRRYRSRVAAYVRSSIPDDGRVDDVVQEVFISALRHLRSLDSPEAFAPWIYRIARNACVDHLRRLSREEVSVDSERLDAAESRHLRPPAPSIHAAVSRKEEIDQLREAFGELPAAQHEALLLRELEGLSYDEIGRRLRLSRPAVESVLFRARRGLKGEFSEISTGARCRHVRSAMAMSVEQVGTGRERLLAVRHMRSCANCRREAVAMGMTDLALEAAQAGPLRRVASKAAAVLPLPLLFARRGAESGSASGVSGTATATGFSAQTQNALVQLSSVGHAGVDQTASMAQKAVAVIATVAVVGGGGVAAVKHGGIPGPLPKITSTTESDHALKSRPDGLPVNREEAAEVLYGAPVGPGGNKAGGQQNAAMVVPPALINASPVPAGGTGNQPPASPDTTSGQSPAASDPTSAAPLSDGTPVVQQPAVTAPEAVPVTPTTPGKGNQKPKKGDGNSDTPTPSDTPVPAPVPTDPAAGTGDASVPPATSVPVTSDLPGNGNHTGWVDGLPRGQAKKLAASL